MQPNGGTHRSNTKREIGADDRIPAAWAEYTPDALQAKYIPKRFGFGFMTLS
jgi:hypothetical protein